MIRVLHRIKRMLADPARVSVCDSCGSVSVCDTSCRAGAARERALNGYLSIGSPH